MNESHLSSLKNKHAEIDELLDREETRPAPDGVLIHGLKKQKLHLKDEITQQLMG